MKYVICTIVFLVAYVVTSAVIFEPQRVEIDQKINIDLKSTSLPFCRDTFQIRADVIAWMGKYDRPQNEIDNEVTRESIQTIPGVDCVIFEDEYPRLASKEYHRTHTEISFDSTPP